MNRPYVPQPVLDAAHARSAARVAQQWKEADRLRAEIEAAGWRVIDSGTDFRLEPADRPDTIEADVVRHGRSAAVPSRMEEPPTFRATIVVVATDVPEGIERTLIGLLAHTIADDQIVVVVDGPAPLAEAYLATLPAKIEIVRTSERLGAGVALTIGLRRAAGAIVVLLDPSIQPTGEIIAPLASMLEDQGVAVAGFRGRRTPDLRRYEDVVGGGDATVITREVLAFRRADGITSGPVDEDFVSGVHLDTWWSLVLRAGAEEREAQQPRRAVVVPDLPVVVWEPVAPGVQADAAALRQAKRNFYRLLDRFRDRADLLP